MDIEPEESPYPQAYLRYGPLKSPTRLPEDPINTTESYFVNQLLLGIKEFPRLTSAED